MYLPTCLHPYLNTIISVEEHLICGFLCYVRFSNSHFIRTASNNGWITLTTSLHRYMHAIKRKIHLCVLYLAALFWESIRRITSQKGSVTMTHLRTPTHLQKRTYQHPWTHTSMHSKNYYLLITTYHLSLQQCSENDFWKALLLKGFITMTRLFHYTGCQWYTIENCEKLW